MNKKITILAFVFLIIGIVYLNKDSLASKASSGMESSENISKEEQEKQTEQEKYRIEKVLIEKEMTFTQALSGADIEYSEIMDIYNESKELYDLAKVRSGREIELKFERQTDELIGLKYQIDSEEYLMVSLKEIEAEAVEVVESDLGEVAGTNIQKEWLAERTDIPYEIRIKIADGEIESSMYQAAIDHGVDERAIIELANAFQWSIDFATQPRMGDKFALAYEERYLDGEYVMPGRILAGKYINTGEELYVYYFEENEENKGFFDENANSVQKMFLKSPVEFRYISSGFTTGLRCLEAFGLCTNHRAIDYASPCGTPIRVVGDGTVTFAGWSSVGYGYLTKIRHNATYGTNYAHQSKMAVKVGQRVKQGDIIGYVGTTGLSTGCHLHYEMVKNGTKINALHEVLPPGEPIKEENKERFYQEIGEYKEELDNRTK
jgi:murein DD-endopeptidase MepM/ murein hydrolase activator NlpD